MASDRDTCPIVAKEDPAAVENAGALTLAQVQGALRNLGHNGYGEVAYTTLALKSLGLTSIAPLSGFPFLQFISLDDNHLTSLAPLGAIEGLVYLSARRNELRDDGVFPHLAGAATSLERLHLDGNRLTSLEGLARLAYLTDLTVADNQLTALLSSDFAPLKALIRLTASRNAIAVVEPHVFAGSRQVRVVDLADNQLTNLHFVAYITANLETLRLAQNRISTVGATISACQSLVSLDLSRNALATVEELHYLRPVRLLRSLCIAGNPFCRDDGVDASEGKEGVVLGAGGADNSTDEFIAATPIAAASEQVVPDAADWEASVATTIATKGAAGATVSAAGPALDYAALAEPSTYSVVRHVLTASRMAIVPWDIDRGTELAKLPAARQVFLRLLYLLPSLMTVDGAEVLPQDVARAKFFFTARPR